MFKKIEIWILYLVILFSLLFAIGFGVLVRQELVGSTKFGWVSKTALFLAEIPMNVKKVLAGPDRELLLKDRFSPLEGFNGTPNKEESYMLLSRYDGDLGEGITELVDLTNFNVLHTWNPDIDAFNSSVDQTEEVKYLERDEKNSRAMLIHPELTNDGGLIFNNNIPLRKIDACSNLIFQNTHDRFHHAIETDADGNIWVPSRMYPQSIDESFVGRDLVEEGGFYDDAIAKLSPDGELLYEKSVSQIFIENGLRYLIFSHGNIYEKDPIHLNDIQPVNSNTEYWKKGDVFLSLRNQSMIVLYRPSTNEIIWKGTGPFLHQHDVDILDKNKISIFSNNTKNGKDNKDYVHGYNEIIIYDFETNKYSSYLKESLASYDVRTITQGLSEILQNGDLFIEETNYGRTLYFNSDGSLKWSHYNRANNGNVFSIGWSRILYTKNQIENVKNFLKNKSTCPK